MKKSERKAYIEVKQMKKAGKKRTHTHTTTTANNTCQRFKLSCNNNHVATSACQQWPIRWMMRFPAQHTQ